MELKDLGILSTVVVAVQAIFYQFYFLPKFNKSFKTFEMNLKQQDLINSEKWKLKRDACFNALNIADNLLSNYPYPNVKKEAIKQGEVRTEDVRKCFNDLACSCEHTEVIDILKVIISGSVTPDIIVDLRNAVRKELGFGNDNFDTDRINAFVGLIGCDKDRKK